MNINKAIQLARKHFQTGNLQQAEHIYRKILTREPHNVDALHFRGVIHFRLGNDDSAIKYIKKALQFNSNNPEIYNNLGNVLQSQGHLDSAIECYQNALKLDPNFADAYYNMGNTLQSQGHLDGAIDCYQNALKRNPNDFDTYIDLGLAFRGKEQFDNAIECYQKAIQLNPSVESAYNNLGIAFWFKGQFDNAIACYQKAIQLNPNLSDAYNNLAIALKNKGQIEEPIIYYKKAIELNSNFAIAIYNLGNALLDKGQLDEAIAFYQTDEAIACYRRSIQLNPKYTDAYFNLGIALWRQGKRDEAIINYEKVILLNPHHFRARFAKCISQLPIIYSEHSDIQICRDRYFHELIKLRDSFSTLENINSAADAVGDEWPFFLAYQGLNNRELQHFYGNLICRVMSLRYPEFADRPTMPSHSSGKPLRIGFVSGFFWMHSNWKIPIKGWIENIDKKQFSLYGYYTGIKKDKATEDARRSFTCFVEDIYSFEKLCKIIRDDNLHVLIYPGIGMDRMTTRLASLRLAPIQCASWGHPDTSGLPTIDYYLSSDLMEPPEANDHYC